MSDLIVKVLTGVLRVVLAPLLTWLINKNIITGDESLKLVAEVFSYALTIGWTAYAWVKAHRTQNTALAMPWGSTPADLKDQMRSGATASALTPPNAVPDIARSQPVKGVSA